MNYTGNIIKIGSTDEVSVKAIKVRLNNLMHSTLDVTNGKFGSSTEAVVKAFQKKNQLLSDGVIGQLTWERLFTVKPKGVINAITLVGRVIQIALSQTFVREKTNKNDGEEVEMFLKAVGLGKGFAWCMAFVYWCFAKAALELKVVNPVPKTAGVLDCFAKAKKLYLVTGDPQPGDQFIMDFGKGAGHTGLVTEYKKDTKSVYTVEGNTAADPSYAGEDREGNGVFERNRKVSGIKAFLRYE